MNPRVSRSSALASKATGYPIAKLAAKLAVGYTLDELPNYITSKKSADGKGWEYFTSACFEPTIDYCVIKIPRWTFEKFPDADETLTTQMKSVGEAMAIGRTFKEALQKGIRSMEVKRFGFGLDQYDKWLNAQKAGTEPQKHERTQGESSDKTTQGESSDQEWPIPEEKLRRKLAVPSQGRLYYIRYAMKMGWSIDRIYELTKIDRWFLAQMKELVDFESELLEPEKEEPRFRTPGVENTEKCGVYADLIVRAKTLGYSDVQLARIWKDDPRIFRRVRQWWTKPVYKLVDTCAAEFEASTPYYYSTYETSFTVNGESVSEDEIRLTDKPKVIIIGGGPNRIGQGIEFDYCCVQAAFAMKDLGLESVMINSNPETVSTDYDTSDLLFFEPLTHEDILNICERLNGRPFDKSGGLVKGVIVQFGGQTPLNLARGLKEAGVPILGTTVESLDAAGDREQFRALLQKLGLKQPANGIARSVAEAREIANRIGYPVLVRPSFVLGGRAMEIVSDEDQLNFYMANAVEASTIANAPILVDKFLDAAIECDVDCLADFDPSGNSEAGQAMVIGVMEHIEEAGIHSGDSACSLPPYSLSKEIIAEMKRQTRELASALRVRGLMNVQYAIKNNEIYVIEVNPRASRTVPFVSKAQGQPFAKIAAKVMAGKSLAELGIVEPTPPKHVSVKEVVFPFSKFPGVDVILGPEMRSTGEVMGIDADFPHAFAKSQIAAGTILPSGGTVFISVRHGDQQAVLPIARAFSEMGFQIIATAGTHEVLRDADIPATRVAKLSEGRPNIQDYIKNGQIQMIINTPTKKGPATDEGKIRAMSVLNKIPIFTTITAAGAVARAIKAIQSGGWGVKPLQAYFSAPSSD
jgi:carbamoyl-phosphate synthase large subunit